MAVKGFKRLALGIKLDVYLFFLFFGLNVNIKWVFPCSTVIILWYYFTSWKEDPPYMELPLLRQNLGAKTIWVDLTLKMTPPPLFLDPIHLSGSALFLYYISSRYSINKLLRNLTLFRQHVLLLCSGRTL